MLFKIVIFFLSFNLLAQDEEILFFLKEKSKAVYDENKNFEAHLYFKISAGWHINSNKIKDEFLIPTEIKIEEENISIDSINYPKGENVHLSFSKKPLLVYTGSFEVQIKGKVKEEKEFLEGKILYQGCNDQMCLPPQELKISLEFEKGNILTSNPIEGWISQKGIIFALIFLFLGGLALNLTPCVYPMVPITIGFFSKQKKGFALSLSYFLGIVITYSLLGTLSALGGSMFGSLLQKPAVLIIVSIIIFILSLSLFGLFTIKFASSFSTKFSGKGGMIGTFLMGAMVGLVAAPCLGPIILSLITFVASKGNVFIGFLFFMALASGIALPYLVLSFFSSSIKELPKSGEWMISLERFFGFALVGVAIFILSPILPEKLPETLYIITGIISTIYFLSLIFKRNKVLNFILMLISLIFSITFINSIIPKGEKSKLFLPFVEEKFLREKNEGKLIMIDFFANWCIPCKEMEHKTFSNKEVQEILKNFILYQVDLTKGAKGEIKDLVEELKIVGIPTIVFFKNGKEMEEFRLVGFEGPEEFKNRLMKVME